MKNERNSLPLKWIVRSFYLVCVVLSYSEDESRPRQNVYKIVDTLIVVFLIYVICNDLFLFSVFYETNGNQWKPFGFLIAALSGDLCSLSIRLVLIAKRQHIAKTLRNVFSLYRKPETERDIKCHVTSLTSAFALSWIIPLILYIKSAIFAVTDKGSREFQMKVLFGYYSQDNWGVMCGLFINLFLLQQLYAMPGYAAGLCYYAYKILTAAIENVEKNLRRKSDLASLYNAYINLTSKLIDCIDEVEHALSLLLFLLYTYIISFIFTIITLLIRIAPQSNSSGYVLINSVIVFTAIVAFFGLSFQSVYVHKTAVRIRRTIYRMCSKISWPTDENEDAVRLLLLTASDTFPTKILITGWNMFELNEGFILQTTGAIVSYGTIVSQLGSYNN
ncbi:hypothetical protein AVEN_130651-1 [Araneus ventricosus]|uniref:Gustatory receptor n=1 Tax=Araneus ventricosus TaxID=182803 RepID=A0A4Y2X2S6_ARAVE|nr:hypothetical protein AVEN_111589-1 [Araneus ventricosus]GBO42491.1 hypothetical protein AVEN_130651-1 [Araneus ventricosus]